MAKDKQAAQQAQYDSPWKQAIEGYFPDFMTFFFPGIYDEIDWNKEPVFMDNALEKITRDAEIGKRYADKLVKVWLKTEELAWVLIHIEVQASRETNFAERIYVYRHRIGEKHKVDVASLVILCDDEQNYRPNKYKKGIWGCELNFTFPIVKLLDFAENWTKLECDRNPFAIVVMAQLKAKEIKDGQQRKYWKFRLTRMLYERGYEKQDIIDLYCFIDWLLVLPEDLEKEFVRELCEFEKEKTMQYVSSIERIGFKKGKQQGMQHGMQQGVQQGMRQGMQQGESTMLVRQMERKFGQVSEEVKQKIEAADSNTLLEWGEKILSASTIEDVFH
ncbi:MAG: cytosolic protein [Candidatus Brocadiaceae bacterium]|nr:cytosolic protein [Candidatus Brocadiaceae bacterium]